MKVNKRVLLYFLLAALLSTAVSTLLVCFFGGFASTKAMGADNSDVRSIYYHTIANVELKPELCDRLVLYNPLVHASEEDKCLQLAQGLSIVAEHHPQMVVFDYILHDTTSFSSSSRNRLVEAIQACVDSGIVFIASEVRDIESGNDFMKFGSERSFFLEPPYSLDVESANALTMFDKLDKVYSDSSLLWLPIAVSRHLPDCPDRPASFYKNRYLSFAPGVITTAHRGHTENDLDALISSKIVLFSDYNQGDDMHELLSFPVRGIPDADGESNKKVLVSGAELLWYSIRDELDNKWDVEIPLIYTFIVTFLITFLYFCCLWRIKLKFAIWGSDGKLSKKLLESLSCFAHFGLYEILLLPLLGVILMHSHLVLPVAIPAISLVIVNLCDPLWEANKR